MNTAQQPLIILGADPGLANTGWGIVAKKRGQYRALAYGCIHTSADISTSKRLKQIFDELLAVIDRFHPTELGIESIFFGANSQSAFATGQAKGAILIACASRDMHVEEYTPMQIKQSVTGTGTASKEQVQYMVRSILRLEKTPTPDHAADALAAAVCHGNLRELRSLEAAHRAPGKPDPVGRRRG